jgi:hypothetical protein
MGGVRGAVLRRICVMKMRVRVRGWGGRGELRGAKEDMCDEDEVKSKLMESQRRIGWGIYYCVNGRAIDGNLYNFMFLLWKLYEFICSQKKKNPHAVRYRQRQLHPRSAPPRVFSSANTRAHESRKLSLVQSSSSTDHSHLQWCGCHPFPILSPARVFSSSPLPSGIASCRSKSEFGPSSPHHQSGNLSANFCRTDYILSPPTSHCLLWAEKVEAFAFFPTNIWSHAFCSFGLGVKLACERAPIGWLPPSLFHFCKRPSF